MRTLRLRGIPRRLLDALRWRYAQFAEYWFDRRRGMSTAGIVRAGEGAATTNYQPVHPKAFADFLPFLPRDRARLTFVDYGSGRGRAVVLAIEHGFGAAVGVELDAGHHALAVANIARRDRRHGLGGRIRLVLGDARELPLPDGPIVVFIYNPFPRDVLAEVLRQLVESLSAAPRPAWVIYQRPIDRDLLDDHPRLELVAERTKRDGASSRRPRFAIYRWNAPYPA